MTDVLTHPAQDQAKSVSVESARRGKRRILIAAVLVGILTAGVAFTTAGPSARDLEEAHWEAVVDHYGQQYQTRSQVRSAGLSAGAEDQAHWEAVVAYYEAKWAETQK